MKLVSLSGTGTRFGHTRLGVTLYLLLVIVYFFALFSRLGVWDRDLLIARWLLRAGFQRTPMLYSIPGNPSLIGPTPYVTFTHGAFGILSPLTSKYS
jgi:hypothetical protein